MSGLPTALAADSPEAWIYQEHTGEGAGTWGSRWRQACARRRGECFEVLRVPADEAGPDGDAGHGHVPLVAAGPPHLVELAWQGEGKEAWWEAVERVWHSDASMVLADAAAFWGMTAEGLGGRIPELDKADEDIYKILTRMRALTFKTGRGKRENLQL